VKHSLGLSTKSRNSHSIQKPHVARQNLDVLPEGVPPSGMPSARLRPGLFLKKNISPFLPDRNLLPASKVSVDTYSTYLSVQRDRRVLLRPRWSLVLFRKSDASTVWVAAAPTHLGMIGVIRPRSFGRQLPWLSTPAGGWIASVSCDCDAVLFYANKSVLSDIADHPSVDTYLYVQYSTVAGHTDTS
jgi:hypothetical protein